MGKRSIPLAQYATIAAAYKNGATTVALAAQHEVSEGTIRMVLQARGQKTRPRAERAQRAHRAAGRGGQEDVFSAASWLHIPPDEWAQLRAAKDDDALVEYLATALAKHSIPYPNITPERAMEAFEELRAEPFEQLFGVGPIKLLRSSATEQAPYHLALKPPGSAASNQLFYKQRWSTPRSDSPSVEQRWRNPELRKKVCRRFLKIGGSDRVSASTFRRALCVTGGTPSQFKPGAARALYELTGAKDVLDFSAGWGDRLVGFCATPGTRRYVGIDPNQALHPLYREAAARYAGHKTTEFICAPAEDVALVPESFDLAMTSPPYFGVERYAAGAEWARDQSWARYSTADAWRAGFLAQVIRHTWAALRPGGVLAINLADAHVAGCKLPLSEWLRQEVGACSHAQVLPTIGMRLQSGNYSAEARSVLGGEPVWMWSKGLISQPLKQVHRNIGENEVETRT